MHLHHGAQFVRTASEKAEKELGNEADTREEPKNGFLTGHLETLKWPSLPKHLVSASYIFFSFRL